MVSQRIEDQLCRFLSLFAFLLPWQTIWIYRELFVNGYKWEFGTLGYYMTEVLLWGILFFFFALYAKRYMYKDEKLRFHFTKDRLFVFSLLFFILYTFASSLWAPDPELARQYALRIMEASLFFLMLSMLPNVKRRVAAWFITGMSVQALLGLWQFVTQSTFASTMFGLALHPVHAGGTSVIAGETIGRWLRAYGGFSHPNVLGGMLVVSLVLVTCIFFDKKRELSRRWRMLVMASVFIQVAALFFTFSRSAWIAFGVLWCWWAMSSYKRIALYVAILIFAFGSIYAPLLALRFGGGSEYESRSIEERVGGSFESLDMIAAHPWFGTGAGNYTAMSIEGHPDKEGWQYQPVHNVGLLFVAEFGIVGLLLLLGVVATYLRLLMSPISSAASCPRKNVLLFFLMLLPLVAFDHYIISSYTGLLTLGLLFAICYNFSAQPIHMLSTKKVYFSLK